MATRHHLCLMAQVFLLSGVLMAGQWPRVMDVYRGSAPVVDGVISPDEYKDATAFGGHGGLMSRFNPTTDPNDLCLEGWVKHDGTDLYFAFSVTDNMIYGVDTDRWLPTENPKAHELTVEGYPWFGDGVEILLNPLYRWFEQDDEELLKNAGLSLFGTKFNAGNGTSWQMACSTTKSYLDGLGKPGLMPAENRDNPVAWPNYIKWIKSGAQRAAVTMLPKGYVIEWQIKADPCLEVAPGIFWTPELGTVKMGLNIAVQDLDRMEDGEGIFGNFNHEDWWAGEKDIPYFLNQWGTLVMHPDKNPAAVKAKAKVCWSKIPFFAMDTGTKDEKHQTAESQVVMLKELGYSGIGYWKESGGLAEMLKQLDSHGLTAFPVYMGVSLDKDTSTCPEEIETAIQLLKGRPYAAIWLYIESKTFAKSSPDGDPKAVELLTKIADAAKASDIQVILYPHYNTWLERIEDGVRVAEKVNRPNLGITFNLCHWLKTDGQANLRSVLKKARPYLFAVTINGADSGVDTWDKLIQPLDQGTFDTYNLLKELRDLGYSGPVGLQGYGIKGDVHENLRRSMAAWKKLVARLDEE